MDRKRKDAIIWTAGGLAVAAGVGWSILDPLTFQQWEWLYLLALAPWIWFVIRRVVLKR